MWIQPYRDIDKRHDAKIRDEQGEAAEGLAIAGIPAFVSADRRMTEAEGIFDPLDPPLVTA